METAAVHHVSDSVASMRALAETTSGPQRAPDQRRGSQQIPGLQAVSGTRRLPSHLRHSEPEHPGVPLLPGSVPVQPAPGAAGPPGALPGLRTKTKTAGVPGQGPRSAHGS